MVTMQPDPIPPAWRDVVRDFRFMATAARETLGGASDLTRILAADAERATALAMAARPNCRSRDKTWYLHAAENARKNGLRAAKRLSRSYDPALALFGRSVIQQYDR